MRAEGLIWNREVVGWIVNVKISIIATLNKSQPVQAWFWFPVQSHDKCRLFLPRHHHKELQLQCLYEKETSLLYSNWERKQKWATKWQVNCLHMSLDWRLQCFPLPVQTSSLWFRLDGREWFFPTFLPGWCRHKQLLQCLCPSCRTEGLLQQCLAI